MLARVVFTRHLASLSPAGGLRADGDTLKAVLTEVFAACPQLKGYILDDQGRIRRHIAVFVDGTLLDRSTAMEAAVTPSSEIYVMQALSGG